MPSSPRRALVTVALSTMSLTLCVLALAPSATAQSLAAAQSSTAATADATTPAPVESAPGADSTAIIKNGIPLLERTPAEKPRIGDLPTIAPTRPPETETQDEVGAAAALLYWIRSLNYAYSTGDITPFVDASAYTCGQCSLIVDDITKLRERGMVQTGGAVVVQKTIYSGKNDENGLWSFSLSQVRYPGTRKFSDGTSEPLTSEGALFDAQIQYQEPDEAGNRRLVVYTLNAIDTSILQPDSSGGGK